MKNNNAEYIDMYEQEQIQRKLKNIALLILFAALGAIIQSLFVAGSMEYIVGKVATAIGAIGLTFYIPQAAPSIKRWWNNRAKGDMDV